MKALTPASLDADLARKKRRSRVRPLHFAAGNGNVSAVKPSLDARADKGASDSAEWPRHLYTSRHITVAFVNATRLP
jgi:hypothetical protein